MELVQVMLHLIDTGGPVMIPICLVSVWLWVLVIFKLDWVWRIGRKTISIEEAIKCLSQGNACPGSANPRRQALRQFMADGGSSGYGFWDQYYLEAAVRRQISHIHRYIRTINTLAAAAPLLGLFGTVSGMVETFQVIGIYGMGNAQAMASGIREAMITTQAGLLIAIPGLFAGQVLRKKANNIHKDLQMFQRRISTWLEKEAQC